MTAGLAGQPIYLFSNEEQRQRWVPDIAAGRKIAAFGLTEPGAGSDPASMDMTATRTKGGYLLNGTKIFITNGAESPKIASTKANKKSGIASITKIRQNFKNCFWFSKKE